jgi:beta-glucanase (GH16 family)
MVSQLLVPQRYSAKELIFSEDFTGETLDKYWNRYMTSASTEGGAWDSNGLGGSGVGGIYDADYDEPYEVYVDDGLTLNAVQQNVLGADYENGAVVAANYPIAAGVVDTYGKMEFDGGYLQISMKEPGGDGSWPGLWLLPGASAGSVGNNFEIDIQEGGFDDGTANPNDVLAYHLHTSVGTFGGVVDTGIDLTASFNTYAINWIPGKSITWYLNGAEVAEITSAQAPIPDESMELIMNNQVATAAASSWRTSLDSSTPESMPMEVGGVQLYQGPDTGEKSTIAKLGVAPTVTISTMAATLARARATISGSVDAADAGSVVTIYDGATEIGTVTASATGTWSTIVSLIIQGVNVVSATDTNAAGTGASSSVDLVLHTLAPKISIVTAAGVVASPSLNLTGAVDMADAGSLVTINDGTAAIGSATAGANGAWSAKVTLSQYGVNVLTASDANVAGAGTSAAIDFDWEAPPATANTIQLGNANRNLALKGFNAFVSGGDGDDVVWSGLGNESLVLGNGQDYVKLVGYNNSIRVGNGSDYISAGTGNDTVIAGTGSDRIVLAGLYNSVTLGAGEDIVIGGQGDDVYNLTGGLTKLKLTGVSESVTIGQGASATIYDLGYDLRVNVATTTGSEIITGLAEDHAAVIALVNNSGGYATVDDVIDALRSDGRGGSLLNLGAGGIVDIASVAPSHLTDANFRV